MFFASNTKSKAYLPTNYIKDHTNYPISKEMNGSLKSTFTKEQTTFWGFLEKQSKTKTNKKYCFFLYQSKINRVMSKDSGTIFAPTGQKWDNLSSNKDNNCNRLKAILHIELYKLIMRYSPPPQKVIENQFIILHTDKGENQTFIFVFSIWTE